MYNQFRLAQNWTCARPSGAELLRQSGSVCKRNALRIVVGEREEKKILAGFSLFKPAANLET